MYRYDYPEDDRVGDIPHDTDSCNVDGCEDCAAIDMAEHEEEMEGLRAEFFINKGRLV